VFACPCCGFLTLAEEPPGTFEVCPVCFWEDDNLQFSDPDYVGGANRISLNRARENFRILGAASREFVGSVRKPLPPEIPT
jgi:Cysteine-rich CPCC